MSQHVQARIFYKYFDDTVRESSRGQGIGVLGLTGVGSLRENGETRG